MTQHIDFDKYCHCILCSKDLRTMKFIDGKEIYVLSNEYDTVQYDLSDDSIMKVCVCKTCKPTITEKDSKQIMRKVLKGWEREIDDHPDRWDKKRKKDYMDRYEKLVIKNLKKEK